MKLNEIALNLFIQLLCLNQLEDENQSESEESGPSNIAPR